MFYFAHRQLAVFKASNVGWFNLQKLISLFLLTSTISLRITICHQKGDVQATVNDVFGENKVTPLALSCTSSNARYCAMLLDCEAVNPNQVFTYMDVHPYTALLFAIEKGCRFLDLLIDCPRVDVNQRTENGEFPIYCAIVSHCLWLSVDMAVKFIKCSRVDVNVQSVKDGETPLICLIRRLRHDLTLMKLMLEREDIDINARGKEGMRALHYACDMGKMKIVQRLLECRQIDVNAKNDKGRTPIHFAVLGYHVDVVQILLSVKGIDVNIPDCDEITPFFSACELGYTEIVRLLLNVPGIDIDHECVNGYTAIQMAARKGHYGLIPIIQEFQARRQSSCTVQ